MSKKEEIIEISNNEKPKKRKRRKVDKSLEGKVQRIVNKELKKYGKAVSELPQRN